MSTQKDQPLSPGRVGESASHDDAAGASIDDRIREINDFMNESYNQPETTQHRSAEEVLLEHKRTADGPLLEQEHKRPHVASAGNGKPHEFGAAQELPDEVASLHMISREFERATRSQPPGAEQDSEDDGDEARALAATGPETHSAGDDSALGGATADGYERDANGTVLHGGVHIPADSELLRGSESFSAYSALSGQLPPLEALASVHLGALPLPITAPGYLPPRIQLLVNTLPTLDNLATQLLRIIAIGPYQRIIDLASNSETAQGATFRDLTSLFEFTKRLYSEEDPFLTVEHLAPGIWKEGERTPDMFRSREQSIESTLRKVNLVTFLAAALGTVEVGFFYLNESFLDVFCPANNLDPSNAISSLGTNNSLQSGVNTIVGDKVGKLLKPQSVLYLDLKTQAYISAVEAGERSSKDIINDIFPVDLAELLKARRGNKMLNPTELDFVDRCMARRQTLLERADDKSLSDEYEWFAFLRDLFEFAGKNMGALIWGRKGRMYFKPTSSAVHTALHSNKTAAGTERTARAKKSDGAAPAAPAAPDSDKTSELEPYLSALLPLEIQQQHVLQVGSGPAGRQGRRPWTREEEKALRHALELKGPLWSTILELFGAGGKISEALKNRSQVQLKDKARNWKMFFLKSGLPVPGYLVKVTGDMEREDKNKVRADRSRKNAAAPVPNPRRKKV